MANIKIPSLKNEISKSIIDQEEVRNHISESSLSEKKEKEKGKKSKEVGRQVNLFTSL